MESVSSKASSSSPLSPFSCQTIRELLRVKIVAWSQETGLPASVHVQIIDKTFNLHKQPLCSKSEYFRRKSSESLSLMLPSDFPGGLEAFEMVALFCYTSSLPITPFNVAALRCASEFLEMTEDCSSGNLIEKSNLYLNHVVFQNWDYTLIVLQKCQALLPWAEDLLIVSRCVESLAFMACMEILDPEQGRGKPVTTLLCLLGHAWNCDKVKQMARQDVWMEDLISLPFVFFKRIIGSLRRQGMKEKYVSPLVVFYGNQWVLSNAPIASKAILKGVIDLLPSSEKASRVIPVGFYLSLLSQSIDQGLGEDIITKLQVQIGPLLHLAHVEDFPCCDDIERIGSSVELGVMVKIVSIAAYAASSNTSSNLSVVGELWDVYLTQVARDPKMIPARFIELIEMVPTSARLTHDHLYQAMSTFMKEHPHVTQEEKSMVCKHLNCQKLSQETCIEAVQNELMPLRFMVQALFLQQLNTHQAFKECSESFRFASNSDLSGSLSGTKSTIPKSQTLEESPYKNSTGREEPNGTLGLLQKDMTAERREEYESTSFRIQSLEQELLSLKKSLQWQNMSKEAEKMRRERSVKKKEKNEELPISRVGGWIGSVGWTSHRKYATKLVKILRRLTMFRRAKSNKKHPVTGLPNGRTRGRKSNQTHEDDQNKCCTHVNI